MSHVLRVVPQALTGGRLVLGTAALAAAVEGRLDAAATLICLGAVTDGLDGMAARAFHAVSAFGALFDYFADYVCYVMAPWAVARSLLGPRLDAMEELALALPLMTSAIRYARHGVIVADPTHSGSELPGLGTVYFAFLTVVAVFSHAQQNIPDFALLLVVFIVAFSILMIAPVRCPKISQFPSAAPVVLALIAIMPFLATTFLAVTMFVVGLLYPTVASVTHLLHSPKRHARAH